MQVIDTELRGLKILLPKKFGDHRGFFSEVFSQRALEAAGIHKQFVQDNHSLSAETGVVRGLHYQIPPMAQDKLLRVVCGKILDIVVDIRKDSPTFGKSLAVELSAENWKQLYVPAGFAHGFVTQEPNCEVLYKVTNYYSPEHERGLRWNDPALRIDWGVNEATAVLSARDKLHPLLKDLKDFF